MPRPAPGRAVLYFVRFGLSSGGGGGLILPHRTPPHPHSPGHTPTHTLTLTRPLTPLPSRCCPRWPRRARGACGCAAPACVHAQGGRGQDAGATRASGRAVCETERKPGDETPRARVVMKMNLCWRRACARAGAGAHTCCSVETSNYHKCARGDETMVQWPRGATRAHNSRTSNAPRAAGELTRRSGR